MLFFQRKDKSLLQAIEDAEYTVLDTETTGIDPQKDSIVSFGAVKMKGGRIDIGSSIYRLINPSRGINHSSIVIHGITPSDVAEEPLIDAVLPELAGYCGNNLIIGHFISLDLKFINRELKRIGRTPLKNHLVDTCRIYEWLKSNEGSFSRHYSGRRDDLDLFSLAREYDVPFAEGHNALGDAFITAQLFQKFLSRLPGSGVKTVQDLLRIGKA